MQDPGVLKLNATLKFAAGSVSTLACTELGTGARRWGAEPAFVIMYSDIAKWKIMDLPIRSKPPTYVYHNAISEVSGEELRGPSVYKFR